MLLNHPETFPTTIPLAMEKLSSTKLVPGAKKVGDCWRGQFPSLQLAITLKVIPAQELPMGSAEAFDEAA